MTRTESALHLNVWRIARAKPRLRVEVRHIVSLSEVVLEPTCPLYLGSRRGAQVMICSEADILRSPECGGSRWVDQVEVWQQICALINSLRVQHSSTIGPSDQPSSFYNDCRFVFNLCRINVGAWAESSPYGSFSAEAVKAVQILHR